MGADKMGKLKFRDLISNSLISLSVPPCKGNGAKSNVHLFSFFPNNSSFSIFSEDFLFPTLGSAAVSSHRLCG